MAIKSIFFYSLAVILVGCSALQTRDQFPQRPGGSAGPGMRQPGPTPSQNVPLPPPPSQKPKVGLILGPGGAKAFAHVGVLKELEKSRIPIDFVVGIEHGALVGALYAANGKANEVEWKMNKLVYKGGGKGGFFKSGSAPNVNSVDSFLDENFTRSSTSNFALNFSCTMTSTQTGYTRMAPSGSVKDTLHNCLPYPPLYSMDRQQIAGVFGIREASDHLKNKGAELIIYVNVLDQGVLTKAEGSNEQKLANMLWFELRKAQEAYQFYANDVINVTTRGFEIEDFENRRKLVSAGEQAGRKAADRLSSQYGF
jgi:NTE family protein